MQGRPWEAVPFRRELIESLTSLRRLQYGDTEFCSPEYILWQLESGPAGRAVCWIALSEEGRAVGEYWMVPVRYLLGAREVLGAVGANALVHPKYRRRSVFQSLGRQCSAECTRRSIELTLYVPNEYSIGGLLGKFGCKDLGGIPVLVYPVDPTAIAQRVSSNQWVRRAAEHVLRWSRRTRRSGGVNNICVVPVSTCDFGPEFDEFWQRVLGKYPCMAIRDRSFMKWRYSSVGDRSYEARYARVGAAVTGYSVTRMAAVQGMKAGFVVDLLCEPSEIGRAAAEALVEEAKKRLAEQGAQLICSLVPPHTQEYGIMRQCGFLPCPARFKPHPFRLVLQRHGCSVATPAVGRLKSWFWSLGDYDAI